MFPLFPVMLPADFPHPGIQSHILTLPAVWLSSDHIQSEVKVVVYPRDSLAEREAEILHYEAYNVPFGTTGPTVKNLFRITEIPVLPTMQRARDTAGSPRGEVILP